MSILKSLRAIAIAASLATLSISSAYAQAAADTAAPSTSNEVAKQTVENPYGLDALWKGGDFVAKGTLLILIGMSIGSWIIIFSKLYEQSRLFKQGKQVDEQFWSQGRIDQAIESLDKEGAYFYIAEKGSHASEHHGGLLGYIDLNTWVSLSIQRAIDKVQSRLQQGLAFLATVGSTAPFVGLFGTVWGIYHALTAIGIAGQASIDKVAGPVGEALIMTAIGLAVAVPAVLGYNWLVRRNKTALEEVRTFGADLHSVILGSAAERSSDKAPKIVHSIRAISV
jgi:biopolymer transport protein ExbB